LHPMDMDFLTWQEMCGSGVGTGMMSDIMRHRRIRIQKVLRRDPDVLQSNQECGTGTVSTQWSITSGPNSGYLFGPDENPVTLDGNPHPVPEENTSYLVELTDSSSRATIDKTVHILVAMNPEYFDIVVDNCNNLMDLWFLCPEWLKTYPQLDDPDGDGRFSVLDYPYINLTDPIPCP